MVILDCRKLVRRGCHFHQDDPDAWKHRAQHGVLAVEMEANAFYTLASPAAARALAISTVSDSLVTREDLPPGERERSFRDMIELAPDTAVDHTY